MREAPAKSRSMIYPSVKPLNQSDPIYLSVFYKSNWRRSEDVGDVEVSYSSFGSMSVMGGNSPCPCPAASRRNVSK